MLDFSRSATIISFFPTLAHGDTCTLSFLPNRRLRVEFPRAKFSMLAAEKNNEVMELSLQMQQLQLKEFQYLYSNLQNLIIVTSLLVGFARIRYPNPHPPC